MSASDTNLEKQAKRHRASLTGIAFVLAFAGILFVGFLIWTAYQADNPTAQTPAEYLAD